MSKLISCVISCYNEEKNLPILVDQIKSNKLESKFQFIIVNNGSKDNSSSVIKELEKKNKEIQRKSKETHRKSREKHGKSKELHGKKRKCIEKSKEKHRQN